MWMQMATVAPSQSDPNHHPESTNPVTHAYAADAENAGQNGCVKHKFNKYEVRYTARS